MNMFKTITACAVAVLLTIGGVSAAESTGPITAEQAKAIALQQTGGGQVFELDRRARGDGLDYFRLEIAADDGDYHIEINASNGRLLQFIRKHGRRGGAYAPSAAAQPRTASSQNDMTLEQAQAIALERTGGGVVVESEVDVKRSGRVVYEFEIVNDGTKFDIDIDGVTGSIVKFKQKGGRRLPVAQSERGAAQAPAVVAGQTGVSSQGRIGMEAAQAIAMERTGGGSVTKYKLDRDDGRLIHEITIVNGGVKYEVEIDDATGTIMDFDVD